MEKNHFSAMDELKRILLPAQLCTTLGRKSGHKVTAKADQANNSLAIHAAEDGDMMIDDLNRIELNEGICSEAGLKVGKISISLSTDGLYLVLKNM